jgi:V/A-type H+-transporting ATPase subunit B
MDLAQKKYTTISFVSGPLLFVERAKDLSYGSLVNIYLPDGTVRSGQTIEISEKHAVIQVFEETRGIDVAHTSISLKEDVARLAVSKEMIGRRFNGLGEPIDGLPPIIPEARPEIIGSPINPTSRAKPEEFIQTGISSIDGFNTLVRGQKLPIFSGAGLPANEIAAQIVRQARVLGEQAEFAVVFAAMGITHREASFFIHEFESTGALSKTVVFLNQADDPTIERLLTPRCALTCAEHLAYEHDYHVLVILTDMTSYCEALREVGTAREEIPGRRGYPGYMYTDLATIYERAGRIHGRKGSITQIPILTMPDDDITHPIADLTGYITEGQLVLSRQLHRLGYYPPIDVLPSLSRLMNNGIGVGHTREDHREWSNQLYAAYSTGRDLRKLVAIIGEEALTPTDRMYLKLAETFEQQMINQGNTDRSILETLELGWRLLSHLPERELKRVSRINLDKYYIPGLEDEWETPTEKLSTTPAESVHT